MKQRKEITAKNRGVIILNVCYNSIEKKCSHLYHLCDSFYLFTMRSVNSNIKLLQYSKNSKVVTV